MARVLGVDIPDNKRGEIALTYIYGIARSSANKILKTAQIDKDRRVSTWTDDELKAIRTAITGIYKIEGDLKSEIRLNIKRLIEINSYRGKRHQLGLPVHGQRTRTNARTRKGKPKTVANKKKATK
ncbi:30S ribosomal protein S13 [Cardinium endosymbiont of Culicoides punctatus]|uniref:30S ribosomal protein S13 n=1 Tax=Cardinium endosymbiont of Culicoides punctatus TaxID=2304601 RepID=UPI001058E37A|nr:30S ribosomal protein S13 [Cardinium endosymbiont of Culicoides punctatus]TDG95326.1 30S ribosomal protein S13 [Cardinium endosymbiont of Culicoides punctatus]